MDNGTSIKIANCLIVNSFGAYDRVVIDFFYRRFRRRLADVDFFLGVVGVAPLGDVKPKAPGAGAGEPLDPNVDVVAPPNKDGAGGGPPGAGAGVGAPLNENADEGALAEDGAGAEEKALGAGAEEKALGASAEEEKPKLDGAGAVEDDDDAGAGV